MRFEASLVGLDANLTRDFAGSLRAKKSDASLWFAHRILLDWSEQNTI